MADESTEQSLPTKGWWRNLMSSSPEASYGRVISACAFISLLLLHIVFSINPHGIFTAIGNQPQVLQYLFILVISGYSVTSAKDMVPQISSIFSNLFNKKPAAPPAAAANVMVPDDKAGS
jgi:hypothetical protein